MFRSGMRGAVADRFADGRLDIVAGSGSGRGPLVQTFDGRTLSLVDGLRPYDPVMTAGVFVG